MPETAVGGTAHEADTACGERDVRYVRDEGV